MVDIARTRILFLTCLPPEILSVFLFLSFFEFLPDLRNYTGRLVYLVVPAILRHRLKNDLTLLLLTMLRYIKLCMTAAGSRETRDSQLLA